MTDQGFKTDNTPGPMNGMERQVQNLLETHGDGRGGDRGWGLLRITKKLDRKLINEAK